MSTGAAQRGYFSTHVTQRDRVKLETNLGSVSPMMAISDNSCGEDQYLVGSAGWLLATWGLKIMFRTFLTPGDWHMLHATAHMLINKLSL